MSATTGTLAVLLVSAHDSWLLQERVMDHLLETRAANARSAGRTRKLADSSETADCDSMYDVAQNLRANNSYMLSLAYFLGFALALFLIVWTSVRIGRRLKPLPPRYWSVRAGFGIARFFSDEYRNEVDVTAEMRDKIQKIMDSTTDPGRMGKGRDGVWAKHKSFEVTKVTRVENGKLWTRYQQCKNHIKAYSKTISEELSEGVDSSRDTLKSEADSAVQLLKNTHTRANLCLGADFLQLDTDRCETMLFHGCPGAGARNAAGQKMYLSEDQSPVGVIKQQGFDDRLGSVSGMLGSGTYFADKASKADCYSGRYNPFDSDYTSVGEEATMFLARVVMGTPYLTKQSLEQLRRPPCVHGHFDLNLTFRSCTIGKPWQEKEGVKFQICEHPRFDSVISDLNIDGKTKLYREFVVYDKQTYPEFCITYRRRANTPTNNPMLDAKSTSLVRQISGISDGGPPQRSNSEPNRFGKASRSGEVSEPPRRSQRSRSGDMV